MQACAWKTPWFGNSPGNKLAWRAIIPKKGNPSSETEQEYFTPAPLLMPMQPSRFAVGRDRLKITN
jgi:hypothetical protein